jgi:protein ImuA
MSAVFASASRRIPVKTLTQLSADSGAPLWQADQLAAPERPGCPSGFAALDAQLPGGGWPVAGLTELLLDEPGCGEVRLLAPALARLTGELVWIAPPFPPYAPALSALGLSLERLVWVDPGSEADAAWAAEQVLRSGAGAVLWWSRQVLPVTLRRLHLASQDGNTPLFGLRPLVQRRQSSPAPLRMALQPAPGGCLQVDVFKRRGPALARPLSIELGLSLGPSRAGRKSDPEVAEDVVAGRSPALVAA